MLETNDFSTFFIDCFKGFLVCKSEDGIFKYVNKTAVELAGYKHADDLIGKTDYDLKCDAVNYADVFKSEDKEAFESKTLNTIDIMRYYGGCLKIVYTTRKILHSQNGSVDLLLSAVELPHCIMNEFVKNNFILEKTGSYRIIHEVKKDGFSLSKRETECMFFLLRGKTAKETAKLLNLSYRTIEEHIENIKIKLKCTKKTELVNKAFQLGMHYYIPDALASRYTIKS